MKLYDIPLSRLQHAEAGQFILRLLGDVKQIGIDIKKNPKIAKYWAKLEAQSEVFKLAIQQIEADKETKELALLDHKRDLWLVTLRRQVYVYEYYEMTEEKKAFAAGSVIMNNWKGLEDANYEAETIGIQKLLDTWVLPENAVYAKALNLQPHLSGLKAATDIFNTTFGNRSVTTAQKVVYDAKTLRKEMMDNYTNMAEYVLIQAKNEDDNAAYLKLLEAINNVRHYFADILARRSGKGGGDAAPKEG